MKPLFAFLTNPWNCRLAYTLVASYLVAGKLRLDSAEGLGMNGELMGNRVPHKSEVVLHGVGHIQKDDGVYSVVVSIGESEPIGYLASYDDSDQRGRVCNVDQELFMTLSDLAQRRFGDCTIYQMELVSIIGAFAKGELDLSFPAPLGTTPYCLSNPSQFKILHNKTMYYWSKAKWKLGFKRPHVVQGDRK